MNNVIKGYFLLIVNLFLEPLDLGRFYKLVSMAILHCDIHYIFGIEEIFFKIMGNRM